jgi:hypothetical protein
MSRPTTELAHLFRQLKAPAAARGLPKLAERARAGGVELRAVRRRAAEDRDRQPRLAWRPGQDQGRAVSRAQVAEEFDFSFQASIPKNTVLHLGQLDFLAGEENAGRYSQAWKKVGKISSPLPVLVDQTA